MWSTNALAAIENNCARARDMEDLTKLVLGSLLTVGGGLLLFKLTRRSKKHDDHCAQFVADLNKLIELVGNAGRAISAHQFGNLTTFRYLKKSREAAADQRKQARQLQKRLCSLLAKNSDRKDWELNHLTWVNATDCETGLIIESEYKWSQHQITVLEEATTAYVTWLTNLRSYVILDASKRLNNVQ